MLDLEPSGWIIVALCAMMVGISKTGIPNVAISAVVATSIFSTLSVDAHIEWRIATGVIALAGVIFTSLQAFLNFGDKAEKHKSSGAKYAGIRRELDIFYLELSGGKIERQKALERLKKIADKLNSLASESPTLTEEIYSNGKKDFDKSHEEDFAKFNIKL